MAVKLSAIFASLLIIAGCQSTPYKTQYTLAADTSVSNIQTVTKQKPYSIIVSDVKTFTHGLSTDMTYTRIANVVEAYTLSAWAEPPVQLIKTALANALIASNAYKDVLMSPTSIKSPYRIDATIQTMQQQFSGNQSSVDLSLMVRLVNTATQQLVFSKTYSATEVAPKDNAEGGVEAYNRALARLLPDIVRDVTSQ